MSVLRGASMTPISEEEARALLAMGIEVYWCWSGLKWSTPQRWMEPLSCVRYKKVLGAEFRFYIKA